MVVLMGLILSLYNVLLFDSQPNIAVELVLYTTLVRIIHVTAMANKIGLLIIALEHVTCLTGYYKQS